MKKSGTSSILEFSIVESKRFNLRVFRSNLSELDEKTILREILANNVDILILRVPQRRIHTLQSLFRLQIPLFIADTLLYFECRLKSSSPRPLGNIGLEFIDANSTHISVLSHLVEVIFENYQSHYTSNPLLNEKDILEGYKEWALSYIDSSDEKNCWLIRYENEWIAFATWDADKTTGLVTPQLYGVLPDAFVRFRIIGILTDMVRYTQHYFKENGYRKIVPSTQAHNFAMQTTLVQEGFSPQKSVTTIHLNPLVDFSIRPKVIFEEEFNKSCLENEKTGFFPQWFQSVVENYFSKSELGDFLAVIGFQSKILKIPVPPCRFKFVISFLSDLDPEGKQRSLVKIFNDEDVIVAYAYYDLASVGNFKVLD